MVIMIVPDIIAGMKVIGRIAILAVMNPAEDNLPEAELQPLEAAAAARKEKPHQKKQLLQLSVQENKQKQMYLI
jgi:hypothetical protein